MSTSCSHPSASRPLQPKSPPPSSKQPHARGNNERLKINRDVDNHSDDSTKRSHELEGHSKKPPSFSSSSSPPTSQTSPFQPSPIQIPTATASSRGRHGHDDVTLSHSLNSLTSFASMASLTPPENDPPSAPDAGRCERHAPVHENHSSSFSSSSSAAPALATVAVPTATAAPSRRPRLVRLDRGREAEEESMDSSMDDILGRLFDAKYVEGGSGAGPAGTGSGGGHTSWVLTDWEELEKVTDMGSTSTMGTMMGSITGSFTKGGLVANGMRGSFNSGLKGSFTSPNGGGVENLKGSLVGRTGFVSRVDSIIETPGDVSSSSIFNGSESFFDLGVSAGNLKNDAFKHDRDEQERGEVDAGAKVDTTSRGTFEEIPITREKSTNDTKEGSSKNKTSNQSKSLPNRLNKSSNSANTKNEKEIRTINKQESDDDSYQETTRKSRMSVQEMLMMDFNRLSSSEHSKEDSHDGTPIGEPRSKNSSGRRLDSDRKSEGGNTEFDDDVHFDENEGDDEAKGRRHSSSSTGGGRRSGLMRKLSRRDVSLAYQLRDWNRNESVGSGTAAAIDDIATSDGCAAGTSLSSDALAYDEGDATATNPSTTSMKFPTAPSPTFRSSPTPKKGTTIIHLPTPPPPISPSSSIE